MRYEVREELEILIDKLNKNEIKNKDVNDFIDVWDYEDEYSHNEIWEIQAEFFDCASEYLRKNYEGQYAIYHGTHCVHIITKEYMLERNLKRWTIC